MRVLKLHSSLRFALSSTMFAGLWMLERRAREQAEAALALVERRLETLQAERTTLINENARLIELDQVRARFIADATHELRTPITSLNMRLYLLEHAPPERRAHYLAEFREQINRLTLLTDDLLSISRLDSFDSPLQFEPVDLNVVVEEIMIAYRPLAEASGLSLIAEYQAQLPKLLGEHARLVQVGSNLVANAIHYTPSGHVVVSTLLDIHRRQICLQVADSGMGIPPGDLPHLFKRFYRGQQVRQGEIHGTGLGLSIVKEIVDLHGGTIEVESQVGQGSVFRVYFPLVESRQSGMAAD